MALPLLLVGLAALVLTAIAVTVLKWDTVIEWFTGYKKKVSLQDKNDLGFTTAKKMENGEYKVVQGVFNQKTNKVKDATAYEAKELDKEMSKFHEKDELVIYE